MGSVSIENGNGIVPGYETRNVAQPHPFQDSPAVEIWLVVATRELKTISTIQSVAKTEQTQQAIWHGPSNLLQVLAQEQLTQDHPNDANARHKSERGFALSVC